MIRKCLLTLFFLGGTICFAQNKAEKVRLNNAIKVSTSYTFDYAVNGRVIKGNDIIKRGTFFQFEYNRLLIITQNNER